MPKTKFIVLYTVSVLVSWLMTNGCEARWIQYDGDLEESASDKHKWKKGNEKDHHQSDFAKHEKNSEKGYESKHGYVQFIYHNFFLSLRFRSIYCFERCLKSVLSILSVLRLTCE